MVELTWKDLDTIHSMQTEITRLTEIVTRIDHDRSNLLNELEQCKDERNAAYRALKDLVESNDTYSLLGGEKFRIRAESAWKKVREFVAIEEKEKTDEHQEA